MQNPKRKTRVTVRFTRQESFDTDNTPLDWLEESDARVASWRADEWHFIGIRAKAVITVHDMKNRYSTEYSITSSGLWGIESDSSSEYLADVFREECIELKADIEAIAAGPIEYLK